MEDGFQGKRALVTGAGKGIGRKVSLRLAEYGVEVVAVSRTQSDLDELLKIQPKIKTLLLDIGNWKSTKEAMKDVGPIDLLVNNAAVLIPNMFGEISEEEFNQQIDINVKAVVNITQIIAKGMKERGKGGSIVNVSSIFSYVGAAAFGSLCASKGAVDQLTRTMAIEFGPHNIRVNSVNPTVVRTRAAEKLGLFEPNNKIANDLLARTPLKRFAEVDEVVNAILFLLSNKSSMITGIIMPIDGGLTISF